MKQRLLSICTALALCLTLLPAAAWAAGSDTGGGIAGGEEKVEVDSWTELINAIKNNEDATSIILTEDVTRGKAGKAMPPSPFSTTKP